MARPFFIHGRCGARWALHHQPSAEIVVRGLVVHLHALGEEANKTRHMVAQQARDLASLGWSVLQMDLRGCGDSADELEHSTWDDWLDDVVLAVRCLRQAHPRQTRLPLWLWGVRVGALLAVEALHQRAHAIGTAHLLLWQPILEGRTAVQQLLRLGIAAPRTADEAEGTPAKVTSSFLRQALHDGETLELGGHRVREPLLGPLEASRLTPPAGSAGHMIWLEVQSAQQPAWMPRALTTQRQWTSAGWSVTTALVQGPPFWQTVEMEDAPALLEATSELMMRAGSIEPSAHAASDIACRPGIDPIEAPEQALTLTCAGEHLMAVLTHGNSSSSTGVVIVVGGPQVRMGSHRLFVQLSRALASRGIPSLRFDVRGMGDSTGSRTSFETISPDIEAAIEGIRRACPNVEQVVLWGLCDGASAALLHLDERPDSRVAGLCLLNPWVRSESSLARTRVRHYYWDRLRQADFWRKLMRGGVSMGSLADGWAAVRTAHVKSPGRSTTSDAGGARLPFPDRMARALMRSPIPVLVMLSEKDYTAREFEEHTARDLAWRGWDKRPKTQVLGLKAADHTLSNSVVKAQMFEALADWLVSQGWSPGASQ